MRGTAGSTAAAEAATKTQVQAMTIAATGRGLMLAMQQRAGKCPAIKEQANHVEMHRALCKVMEAPPQHWSKQDVQA
jgi:hypothetical protein